MRKRVSMRAALGDATLLADALPGASWQSSGAPCSLR
jgi:hypothetical protein